MANPGFPRGRHQAQKPGKSIVRPNFPENSMKMKKIEPREICTSKICLCKFATANQSASYQTSILSYHAVREWVEGGGCQLLLPFTIHFLCLFGENVKTEPGTPPSGSIIYLIGTGLTKTFIYNASNDVPCMKHKNELIAGDTFSVHLFSLPNLTRCCTVLRSPKLWNQYLNDYYFFNL